MVFIREILISEKETKKAIDFRIFYFIFYTLIDSSSLFDASIVVKCN